MSAAVPNHRRTKPGGTAYFQFTRFFTWSSSSCATNMKYASSKCTKLWYFLKILQASNPGSRPLAWPDQPPRSRACLRAPTWTPPWRGSADGESGYSRRTRTTSSSPREGGTKVKVSLNWHRTLWKIHITFIGQHPAGEENDHLSCELMHLKFVVSSWLTSSCPQHSTVYPFEKPKHIPSDSFDADTCDLTLWNGNLSEHESTNAGCCALWEQVEKVPFVDLKCNINNICMFTLC